MKMSWNGFDLANRRVFSVCLPELVAERFRNEAANLNLWEWNWLSALLEMSFQDAWIVERLSDCPHPLPVNLEVRIDQETIRRLRYFCKSAGISPATYVQRLLYHLYVTREIHQPSKKTVDSIGLAEMRGSLPSIEKPQVT
jgi:hypothetical protein